MRAHSVLFLAGCLLGAVAWAAAVREPLATSFLEQSASLMVPHSGVSIKLERWEFPEDKRTAIIDNLRLKQQSLDGDSFLEASAGVGDIVLEREVLKEKHLATYYGLMKIGGNEFRMLFDTGSCELWVPSSACNTARCRQHRRYPVDMHRFKEYAPQKLNIQYLSGSVQGPMSVERIELGDVVVPEQLVGLAHRVDISLLDDVVWDGIVGLAYPNESVRRRNVSPLMDTIIAHNVLKNKQLSNQFAYYIDDTAGALTLGGANCDLLVPKGSPASECVHKFGFVPISHKTYWTIQLDDVSVKFPNGRETKGLCPATGCKAIVDTGTYLMYGPAAQIKRVLPASLGFCGKLEALPDITFHFRVPGNWPAVAVTLHPRDYVMKFDVNGRTDCVMGVAPDKDSMWTLGQVFLRSYYTLFDRDNNRIGFARLPNDPSMLAAQQATSTLEVANEVSAEGRQEVEQMLQNTARAGAGAQADSESAADVDVDVDAEAEADADVDADAAADAWETSTSYISSNIMSRSSLAAPSQGSDEREASESESGRASQGEAPSANAAAIKRMAAVVARNMLAAERGADEDF